MFLTDRQITNTIKNGFLHVIIPDATAETGYRSRRLSVDKTFVNRGVLTDNDAFNAEPHHIYHTDLNTINLPVSANIIGILKAANEDNPGLIYETFTSGIYEIWTCKYSFGTWGDWVKLETGGSGVSDHGELTGLSDDDHPQYLNTTRGDARYYTIAATTFYPDVNISIPNNHSYYIQSVSNESKRVILINTADDVYLGGIDVGLSNTYIRRSGSNYIGLLSGYIYTYHPICITDSNTRLQEGSNNAIRNQTNSGYIDVGPQNTTYGHIYTDRGSFYFNKALRATDFILTSDRRFKKNRKPVKNALDKILALKPIYFNWNEFSKKVDRFSDKRDIGYIAQDVEPIVPEVVDTDPNGYKSISYSKLGPIYGAAIAELYELVKPLINGSSN